MISLLGRCAIIVAVMLAGCSGTTERPETPLVEPSSDPAVPGNTTAEPVMTVNLAEVDPAELTERAPDVFRATFRTTAGTFTAEFERAWAPNGVDRFYNLVKNGYYRDIPVFRVIAGFMAQFGIHGDPAVNAVWREHKITDDPSVPGVSNVPGAITFAMAGPNTRTTQLFINYGNNAQLDSMGFTPIGKVVAPGMDVVRGWHSGYGEGAPAGAGPNQGEIQSRGNEYLRSDFPNLSYIESIELDP